MSNLEEGELLDEHTPAQENSESMPMEAPKSMTCSTPKLDKALKANCEGSGNTSDTPTSDQLEDLLSHEIGNASVLSSDPVSHMTMHSCTVAPSTNTTGGDRSATLEQ